MIINIYGFFKDKNRDKDRDKVKFKAVFCKYNIILRALYKLQDREKDPDKNTDRVSCAIDLIIIRIQDLFLFLQSLDRETDPDKEKHNIFNLSPLLLKPYQI